jgi:hypothetical protein
MQSVLVASDGDMETAKAWLFDMDPFVTEANELPHQMLRAMYVEKDSMTDCADASSSEVGSSSRDAFSSEDVYWAHRKGAVRLSREWRKLFRKCVSFAA